MTTAQIIALANAGFTAQQIDAFNQAMGANPANMPTPQTQQVQTAPQIQQAQQVQPTPQIQQVQPTPQIQQAPQVQSTQYTADANEILAQERAKQIASLNQAPAVTPQVTIGMGGNAGNANMTPQLLAGYQAQNRYNAGMTIDKQPTMADITDQIINGAVQESVKK